MKNFLINQYKSDLNLKIKHNYLIEQFSDYKEIFKDISKLIKSADYTLGVPVEKFEKLFSKIVNSKYSIGVGSGTDALFLSLKTILILKNMILYFLDQVQAPLMKFYIKLIMSTLCLT